MTIPPRMGVVIVSFNSADVLLDCLESLLASTGVRLDVVVVDNASTDTTLDLIRQWAAGEVAMVDDGTGLVPAAACTKPITFGQPIAGTPGHMLHLIKTGVNGGFAAGVNVGLANLAREPEIDRFWILNPDSVVLPGTAEAFANEPGPSGGFSLMGGRVLYHETPDVIQIDGGQINRRTGMTRNIHRGAQHSQTPPPAPQSMDFISGASVVASRHFYETVGPMPEDYFLYYEEVDWALRRGSLPLAYCAKAIVLHRAGTAIGSPSLTRPASPFSLYFKHRARMMFMRRHFPWGLPMALAYSLAKTAQLALKGYRAEAAATLSGSLGRAPSAEVRTRLSPAALARVWPKG